MYIPKQFEENRVEVMHDLIRAYPLATLVMHSSTGLDANHIPMHLSEASPYGVLRGHVARANALALEAAGGIEALAVFHGPDAYITPSWYPTKKETGKAVPTWNYAVVHAHGVLRTVDDTTWLRAHLDELTAHNEAGFAEPWAVADAPSDFLEKLMSAIVGVEMVITKLQGKWKVSQNQPAQNQAGVVSGLRAGGRAELGVMAALVEAGAKPR